MDNMAKFFKTWIYPQPIYNQYGEETGDTMQEWECEKCGHLWMEYGYREPVYCPRCGIKTAEDKTNEICEITEYYYDESFEIFVSELSCGHSVNMQPDDFDYCPVCGRKIVKDYIRRCGTCVYSTKQGPFYICKVADDIAVHSDGYCGKWSLG